MSDTQYQPMDKFSVGAMALRIIDKICENPMAFNQNPEELKTLFEIVRLEMTVPTLANPKTSGNKAQ